jgi:hypothetical protein
MGNPARGHVDASRIANSIRCKSGYPSHGGCPSIAGGFGWDLAYFSGLGPCASHWSVHCWTNALIRRCAVPKLRRLSQTDAIAWSAGRRKSGSKQRRGVDKPTGFFNSTWRNSRDSRTQVLKNLRGLSTNALEMARGRSELGHDIGPSRRIPNSHEFGYENRQLAVSPPWTVSP